MEKQTGIQSRKAKRVRLKRELGAALLVAASLPLVAQEQAVDVPPATSSNAVALDSVMVTVRRRAEDGQRVPTSISSVKGDDLADKRITQVQDLQQALPSTNAAFMHTRVSSVAVRGIGSNPANEGLEGSVGLYVDNVFYARPGMLAIDLVDLDQVDLLRGPQGTLFGKNTTGGALNVTTKKPTFTPERSISLSVGNRGYYQGLASFSGPLSETVAGRLSLSRTHDDGWLKNEYDGGDLNSIDRHGLRGQLLWKPDSSFDLRLAADYNHEDDTQGTMVPYSQVPATPLKPLTWSESLVSFGGEPIDSDPKKYKANIDSTQMAKVNQGGISAEANWHLPSGFDLTSISAWRSWRFRAANDGDYSSLSIVDDVGYNVDHEQFSQELRLASPKGERFDYVVGAYYYWQKITSNFFLTPGTHPIALPYSIRDYGKSTTNSYSLFAQGNWHLTPRLDLTAGLRGTYEIKEGSVRRGQPAVGAWNSGNLQVEGFSPSALASLNYRFTDRFMGYSLLSYGEKSGGINISGVNQGPQLGAETLKIDPEKATNFELGFKSEWFDRRLQFNSNLFLTKIKDYQTTTYAALPNGVPVAVLTNAGDAKTYGLEFDIKARPIQGLSLSFNGSYNHARYTRFSDAPCSADAQAQGAVNGSCDLAGKPLVGAPEWILNLGGRYDWFVGDGVSQYLVANYSWRSKAEGSIDDSKYARIPAYGLLNLATGWQFSSAKRTWDVSLWARNLLDKRYFMTALGPSGYGANGYVASVGAPRSYGVTVKLDF